MSLQTRREWDEGREMAREIILRHPEIFRSVPSLSDILFVIDEEATPKSKGNNTLARVSKITGKFVDFVYEGQKLWMLEWFTLNVGNMTRNQKYLLMAHELLHFEFDDENGIHRLRGHDVEEFHLIADRFGTRWTSATRGDVPDIMARDFAWGKQGQSRLNLSDHVGEIAQGVAAAVPGTEITVSAGGKEATAKTDLRVLAAEMVGNFGVDGAKAIVETIRDVKTGNVTPLRRPTGSDPQGA